MENRVYSNACFLPYWCANSVNSFVPHVKATSEGEVRIGLPKINRVHARFKQVFLLVGWIQLLQSALSSKGPLAFFKFMLI